MTSTPEVDTIRARVEQLRTEALRVQAAPLPERDLIARIDADVAALAARAPGITAASLDSGLRQAPGPILARIIPEAVKQALLDAHRPAANGQKPMTAGQKAKRLAELAGELDAAERQEEALVRVVEDRGEEIDRRIDARAELLLEEDL